MKVLTVNAKVATAVTLIVVAIIVGTIVLVFGGADDNTKSTPEVEIVLP